MSEDAPRRPLCVSKYGTWEQVQDEEGRWVCPPDPHAPKKIKEGMTNDEARE